MLNKLLKYDLKYMIKNMSAFYILALIFAILTRIFFSLKETTIVNIIGQICVGCLFAMLANILINTIIRSLVRFRDSLYKDEAYLTHTLPVTKKSIYQSKFIQTFIFTLIGLIVIIISLFITYYTEERWLLLKETINGLSIGLNINVTAVVICIMIAFFLEVINAIQSGYLGIILGYKRENSKIGLSFVFGFVGYTLTQTFILLLLFVLALFNKDIFKLFTSNVAMSNSILRIVLLFAIVSYALVIAIMNIICVKLLNKGVNVE